MAAEMSVWDEPGIVPSARDKASGEQRSGRFPAFVQRYSPHFDARPAGETVSLAVLHFISLPAGDFSGEDVERLFLGTLDASRPGYESLAGLRVSSHFFIRRMGEVRQYVDVFDRAWHAGLSNFRGRDACNDFSVGIELEGTEAVPFEDAQYEALEALLRLLSAHLSIRWVTGHEFIAPGRKIDPGPYFDWARVRAFLPEGVALAIAPEDCDREMIERRRRLLERQ